MVEFVRKKPFGLAMLMAILGFIGGLGTIVAVLVLATSLLGDGPYVLNGEQVAKADFLRFLIPFMAIYLPAALLAAASAWLIHAEDPRSRPALMAYFTAPVLFGPLFLVLGSPAADVLAASVPTLMIPLVAWFYLYRRHSVVDYYAAIMLDRDPWDLDQGRSQDSGAAS